MNEPCFDKENKDYLIKDIQILNEINLIQDIPRKEILGNDDNRVNVFDIKIRISVKGIDEIIKRIQLDTETRDSILALGDMQLSETVHNLEQEKFH